MSISQIEIYQIENGKTEISVKLDNQTVWLSLIQITELFRRDKSVISRHINNIFREGELTREATVANFATVQKEGERYIERNVEHFNLDVIISVGYRIKSPRGTQFRIWANNVLRDYLVKGFALDNERLSKQYEQLKELQESVRILGNVLNYKELSSDESLGLLNIISSYSYALEILDRYDYQSLSISDTSGKSTYILTYEEAICKIKIVKEKQAATTLFAKEKDESFRSSLATINRPMTVLNYIQV